MARPTLPRNESITADDIAYMAAVFADFAATTNDPQDVRLAAIYADTLQALKPGQDVRLVRANRGAA